MDQEAVKLAAEIYAHLVAEMALDTQRFDADPKLDDPMTYERIFRGETFCEEDFKSVAFYALLAANVFAEATVAFEIMMPKPKGT